MTTNSDDVNEVGRDLLLDAIRELYGYAPFERFIEALQERVIFQPGNSQSADMAMRFEGERDVVLTLKRYVEHVRNENDE